MNNERTKSSLGFTEIGVGVAFAAPVVAAPPITVSRRYCKKIVEAGRADQNISRCNRNSNWAELSVS